jgi:hypothetical protein
MSQASDLTTKLANDDRARRAARFRRFAAGRPEAAAVPK